MVLCLLAGNRFFSLQTVYSIEAILTVLLIYILLFFRDPNRTVPTDSNLLLAPADGKVTDIEIVQENEFIAGRAIKIGIFLSIFDVHINRAPCNATVEKITYKKGIYKDARNPNSTSVNESNNLFLLRMDEPKDKLLLRQISGAIARRIVCAARSGQNLTGGEKFGMIKFGSRTELYIPVRENITLLVKTGDKVKAGLTPLIRYQ
jgi:phosphatidylserine decarboxylase